MKRLPPTILKAGLIAGSLDILAAFTMVFINTGSPRIPGVLKYVASGVAGKSASSGGVSMAVLGLLIHYSIAFIFTIFFFWLYPRLRLDKFNIFITAAIYGLFVWLVMNLVVVPLSHVPSHPFHLSNAVINMLILMVCIGLPLSFAAHSFFRPPVYPGAVKSYDDDTFTEHLIRK